MNTVTQIQNLSSAMPYFLLHTVLPAAGIIVLAILGVLATLSILELVQVMVLRLQASHAAQDDSDVTLLGLTFPSDTSKSAFATEQLYTLFHTRATRRPLKDRLTRKRTSYSLELMATRDGGIQYIMAVPRADSDLVQRSLLSYLPGLKIAVIGDYVPAAAEPGKHYDIVELKLSADFVLPLQDHKLITEHDTIAYLTGQMTKLVQDELVGFQLVISPVSGATHPHVIRRLNQIKRLIATGKPLTPALGGRYITLPLRFLPMLLRFVAAPVTWLFKIAGTILMELPAYITDDKYHTNRAAAAAAAPHQTQLNPYEAELREIVRSKTSQHLHEATVRIVAVANSEAEAQRRTQAVITSLRSFSSPHQTIVTRRTMPVLDSPSRKLEQYRRRVLATHPVSQNMVLSSSELSDLYHFPNTDITKTEGLVKSRSRELPAPLSLKNIGAEFDVVLGINNYGGELSPIGLTLDQRQKHTYVIGKTGMGKTTLLTSSIYQDMMNGKGLAVLDPHGDMFRELLQMVPEHRQGDVVVFDPSEHSFPIGLNLLDPGIEYASEDTRNARITSMVISVFKKLSDEAFWGPRMEHILRFTTLTALALPNPTLYTLQRLLTDKPFQVASAKTLEDGVLRQFWQKELAMLGDMQLSAVVAPLTHRLGNFIGTKQSRHILLQEHTTMRVADIMNEGKILLVNLSKGDLGEDQSEFFGTILTSLIWMAAYQRSEIVESKRRDFFMYVDEFQNFATPQFGEIMSEGRKYHISLIVSHQNVAQIENSNLLKIVAGNASTIICLKASPGDEEFILPFMQPEVSKNDIMSLAPYQFFMKTSSEVSEDAFTGRTVPVDVSRSEATAAAVILASREQYGTPRAVVEKYVQKLFKPGKAATNSADNNPPELPLSGTKVRP